MDGETRKLQEVGGTTLTVSLPKDWVDRMHLEAGDEVVIQEDGDALLLRPLDEEGDEEVTCVIDASRCDTSLLQRCIVGAYILGYEAIRIRSDEGLGRSQRNAVHRTMRRLNGISIVEEDEDAMLLHNFIDVSGSSIYVIMRRLSSTVMHMLDSALYALLQQRDDLLDEVREMEDDVDVLYWLTLRQLLTAVDDEGFRQEIGIDSPLHIVGNRTAIKALEEMADSIEDIVTQVGQLLDDGVALDTEQQKALSELSEFVHRQIEAGVENLIEQDLEDAHRCLEEWDRFQELADAFASSFDDDLVAVKAIRWNLRQVVRFCGVLSEIAINRAMEDGATIPSDNI